ncbi:MAG: hypothetical protein OIF55_16755 [Amphritea sp.]|nr:hypothetical protein [Amphritea sp.]
MTIQQKALIILQMAMTISDNNKALITVSYVSGESSLGVTAFPADLSDSDLERANMLIDADIDLRPSRWLTESTIHQQLDSTIEDLTLILSAPEVKAA